MNGMQRPAETEGPRSEARFFNRELSWLDFNARVLALCEDAALPLLERTKFLAIFAQNLDEFFQVRVSGLKEQAQAGVRITSPDGLDPTAQLREIRSQVSELSARQAAVFTKAIAPSLEEAGIHFVDYGDLSDADQAELDEVFEQEVFPVLTPLAVDPAHPFPYISNLSLNLAVVVRDPTTGEERFARVKVPPLLSRFVALADGERFVPLEQLIAAHLEALFPGMEIVEQHPFRVTRDADFELTDEGEDLLAAMEIVLRQRTKFGEVVRLEVDSGMTDSVLDLLCRELELTRAEVEVIDGTLDLGGLSALSVLPRPDLKDTPWKPQTPGVFDLGDVPADIFAALRSADVLVHHPYDSFVTSVEAFIEQAASDPHVLAIKQTLYRTAGSDSGLVRALVKAAEAGKQVVALVELKARFDEQANMDRAQMLEESGVHVVYGLVGLKTHAKILLVVRQEPGGIRRYCHLGTGNYNPKTAHLYEDLGILSAEPELGADVSELFNYLTGYSRPGRYRRIVVAPITVRDELLGRIRREAELGSAGYIAMKMNALVDPDFIDALYDASAAGTRIELVVRGICCLRPGVAGLSEGIHVRSIVGRFLEHSRIYRFGADPETAEYLIGSADLMPRNLDRRVEAIVPVRAGSLKARLAEILRINLEDDVLTWELHSDGSWAKVPTREGSNTQERLMELARQRSARAVDAR